MKNKQTTTSPIPATLDELRAKSNSKFTPYFEIRDAGGGGLLVRAKWEGDKEAPKAHFITNDIDEALQVISEDGQFPFVIIRFMADPSSRTIVPAYIYAIGEGDIEDVMPYYLQGKVAKEQGLAGGGNGGVNPMWYFQQTQALAGQRESNFKELWEIRDAINDKKSEALAGAMKAEILATTNQQILAIQRESLDKEYTAKMQMLEESFKNKQDFLDMSYKFREERLAEREARILKKEEELEEREAEVKEREAERGIQYKEVVTSLGSALPDVISNWAGINLKTAQPLKGKENGNDQPNPEAQKAQKAQQAQREAKRNMRNWRKQPEQEETETEPQNTPE